MKRRTAYLLAALFLGNCYNPSAPVVIPEADFSARQELHSSVVVFENHSKNGEEYLWIFGDGMQSTLFEPSHLYRSPGIYSVVLIVKNNGTVDFTEKFVEVKSAG